MIKIKEFKSKLDEMYGFDILTSNRDRKYAFARKIFTKILSEYGYSNKEILLATSIRHHMVLYYKKTIHDITDEDVIVHNDIIDHFNINIKKISDARVLAQNDMVESIADQMKCMSRRDLIYFNQQIFQPFLEKIEFEKSIINI
jgi:hypothetical protein